MAKVGKYSTGLDVAGPPMSKHGDGSRGGYDQKTNVMGDNGMTKHEKTSLGGRHTATGKRVLVKDKNITRKM